MRTVRKIGIIVGMKFIGIALLFVFWGGFQNYERKYLMGGLFYAVGITIIGICDTLNNGVEKRAKEQDIRSEKLERHQAKLEEAVARRQQKMAEDMLKR